MRISFVSTHLTFLLFTTIILLQSIVIQCVRIPRQFESDNYYEVLGIRKRFAPKKEIKKAYHKLALKYHPDKLKNQSDDNEKQYVQQIFVKITEAYDVLSDDKLKGIYDRYGKGGLEAHSKGMDPEQAGFGFNFDNRERHPNQRRRRNNNNSGNSGFENTFANTNGGRPRPKTSSRKSEFRFSAGGSEWRVDGWDTEWNDPLGIFLSVSALLLIMFIFLFLLTIILGISCFPITIFLIWRWIKKRKRD